MAKLNVLVVDDATFIREFVRRGLSTTIPNVFVLDAVNGRHAQDILVSKPVDIVLCDWEMPEVDGRELLLWMRADERFQNLPFVMVTSRGEKRHVVAAVQAGIDGYVVKPFSIDNLITKMQEALTRRGRNIHSDGRVSAASTSESVAILTASYRKEPKDSNAPVPETGAPRKAGPVPAHDHTPISSGDALRALVDAPRKAGPVPVHDHTPIASGDALRSLVDAPPQEAKEVKKDRGLAEVKAERGRHILSRVAAQLRYSGRAVRCLVQRLDLNGAVAVVPQEEGAPAIMEQVVFALSLDAPAIQVRDLNAVVNAVEVIESRSENRFVRITLRFVDDDPKKNDALARLITAV